MNRIRTDRYVITVVSLSAIAITIVSIMENWEFWVPPIFLLGAAALWIMHITQPLTATARENFYLLYGMLIAFIHGVHETSFFDVSVVFALMLTLFSLMDRMFMTNLILTEYVLVLGAQITLAILHHTKVFDKYLIASLCLHAACVLIIYLFCRVTIRNRLESSALLEDGSRRMRSYHDNMDDFLTNISHELRTPVNVVAGMSSLILKKGENDEVEAIRDAGFRLSKQIEDIQDYTEIRRGSVILEEENYMTTSLINDVVTLFRSYGVQDPIELIIDLDPDVPSMMHGDIKKLHKLFRQLLDNAVKFTGKGGIYIRISASQREYGVNLKIEVTDTGSGISREGIAMLSQGAYQANRARNRSTGGIGLGLPTVYGFVHAMGGFVKIESNGRRGTTVSLSIPQTVIDDTPCLTLKEAVKGTVVFHVDPEKYEVPEVREFYRTMAVNLANGLKLSLYSASTVRELQELMDKKNVTHIFMGQEEYEKAPRFFDRLSERDIAVAVSASGNFRASSNVTVMPKPLYGFPVVRVLNRELNEGGSPQEGRRPVFDGVRALIVDDEPMNLVVATGLFRDYRMITDTAVSGFEALEKYAGNDYDVIFMDHMMPKMDGVEAMKKLREMERKLHRNTAIVALTANAVSGAKEMFLAQGFDGFIAKPIDLGEFEHVMSKALQNYGVSYGEEQE